MDASLVTNVKGINHTKKQSYRHLHGHFFLFHLSAETSGDYLKLTYSVYENITCRDKYLAKMKLL